MTNAINLLEVLCVRPAITCPVVASPRDLVAAIHGICFGFGDPAGDVVFGDLPKYIQAQLGSENGESWLITVRRRCENVQLSVACELLDELIKAWKRKHPIIPDFLAETHSDKHSSDLETFVVMEDIFRRSHYYFQDAATLREMLAFVRCYLISKWPPHGYTVGMEDLNGFVCNRFNQPPIYAMEMVLHNCLNQVPFGEACLSVADLIRSWRKSYIKRLK